ncbi:MAG: HD domain-containing protein [Lentisphaeria bacterium]|nr:HD domain-containing protein [Lentisphaeria bacterium]
MTESSLNPSLIELLYDAASIRRWNDQINPMDFTELDKQSHKMIIAYVLARFEEDQTPGSINWLHLIEGGLFEMLHRIVLTDIKPPIFHKMMAELGNELNEWVCRNLQDKLSKVHGGFDERFRRYFFDQSYSTKEKRVLKAAHFLATQWEFNILYKMCPFIRGTEQIREQIEDQIEDHYDLLGVQKISLKRKTAGFVELCGQLRFQKRWSQSPRIPVTSVLGHMLVVAALTYLAMQDTTACEQRIVNDFWGGLFHDLPEVLTRDITTPVKKSVEKLDELIKKYEKEQMEEKLFPLLPTPWHQDLQYYTEDEFSNRIIIDGEIHKGFSYDEMDQNHNLPNHHPIDGEIIRACDNLAAFIEASLSIRHGVTSRHLDEGVERLIKIYRDKCIGPVDFGQVFRAFLPPTAKIQ